MKDYLDDLQDKFEEEIDIYGITSILADDEDVIISRANSIPNELYNRIEAEVRAIQEEEKSFTDKETKGCDQDHAERENNIPNLIK